MKYLSFGVLALVSFMITGCTDQSSLNGPVTSGQMSLPMATFQSGQHGVIDLNEKLASSQSGEVFFVVGTIEYAFGFKKEEGTFGYKGVASIAVTPASRPDETYKIHEEFSQTGEIGSEPRPEVFSVKGLESGVLAIQFSVVDGFSLTGITVSDGVGEVGPLHSTR
jgi:hypothetical protein